MEIWNFVGPKKWEPCVQFSFHFKFLRNIALTGQVAFYNGTCTPCPAYDEFGFNEHGARISLLQNHLRNIKMFRFLLHFFARKGDPVYVLHD